MKVNAQPNLDRRKVLAAGAVGVGAVGILAACGGDDSSSSSTSSSSSSSGSSGSSAAPSASSTADTGGSSSASALAATSDIPVGSGKIFSAEKVVVTQPSEGDFKCFSAICTHQGCPVSKIDDSAITCTCHNSTFSLTDGSVLGGPATSPLSSQAITVTGGSITLS